MNIVNSTDFENYIVNSMQRYFCNNTYDKWKKTYKEKSKNIAHDEPWLTLVALYSLFGDQNSFSKKNVDAFWDVVNASGFRNIVGVDEIVEISIERILPEIMTYREYLYSQLQNGSMHLYPDRNEIMLKRRDEFNKNKKQQSLEGNTNLDAQVKFKHNGRMKYMFIEAKFLSDIDTKTTYNPVRNQIIRNIDSMIDFVERNEEVSYEDVYFAMLTPKIFRTEKFDGNKMSNLDAFSPQKSRLYCYVMDEYSESCNLMRDLPHRKLGYEDWDTICSNIGWLTFDDINKFSHSYKTINEYKAEFASFFKTRNLD
jgi:hypothetical protein